MSMKQIPKTTQSPPLIIDRELYRQVQNDPLYGPRVQIGIEIGRIIVKGEKDEDN